MYDSLPPILKSPTFASPAGVVAEVRATAVVYHGNGIPRLWHSYECNCHGIQGRCLCRVASGQLEASTASARRPTLHPRPLPDNMHIVLAGSSACSYAGFAGQHGNVQGGTTLRLVFRHGRKQGESIKQNFTAYLKSLGALRKSVPASRWTRIYVLSGRYHARHRYHINARPSTS